MDPVKISLLLPSSKKRHLQQPISGGKSHKFVSDIQSVVRRILVYPRPAGEYPEVVLSIFIYFGFIFALNCKLASTEGGGGGGVEGDKVFFLFLSHWGWKNSTVRNGLAGWFQSGGRVCPLYSPSSVCVCAYLIQGNGGRPPALHCLPFDGEPPRFDCVCVCVFSPENNAALDLRLSVPKAVLLKIEKQIPVIVKANGHLVSLTKLDIHIQCVCVCVWADFQSPPAAAVAGIGSVGDKLKRCESESAQPLSIGG